MSKRKSGQSRAQKNARRLHRRRSVRNRSWLKFADDPREGQVAVLKDRMNQILVYKLREAYGRVIDDVLAEAKLPDVPSAEWLHDLFSDIKDRMDRKINETDPLEGALAASLGASAELVVDRLIELGVVERDDRVPAQFWWMHLCGENARYPRIDERTLPPASSDLPPTMVQWRNRSYQEVIAALEAAEGHVEGAYDGAKVIEQLTEGARNA